MGFFDRELTPCGIVSLIALWSSLIFMFFNEDLCSKNYAPLIDNGVVDTDNYSIIVSDYADFQQKPALVIKTFNDATLVFPTSRIDGEMTHETIDGYEIAYTFDSEIAINILERFLQDGEWWGLQDNRQAVSMAVRHETETFEMSCNADIRPMSELLESYIALPSNQDEKDFVLIMTCPHNFRGNDETFWIVISNSVFMIAVAVQQSMRMFQ